MDAGIIAARFKLNKLEIFYLFALSSVAFLPIYLTFVIYRKRIRVGVLRSFEYRVGDISVAHATLKSKDLNDFMLRPILFRKGYMKSISGRGCFSILDLTCLVLRGAYSGPTQVTYFVVQLDNVIVPDFILRRKRSLETSYEMKGSKVVDENANILIWADDSAGEFFDKNGVLLTSLLLSNEKIVMKGVKNNLVFWSEEGFIRNRDLEGYISRLEDVGSNII